MFNHTHYVPILKGKEGEYEAVKELHAEVKNRLTPFWEVPPIPFDHKNGCPAKTIDEHLDKLEKKILKGWVFKRPTFLDLLYIHESERMNDGSHPLDFVLKKAREKQLQLIPVSGLNRNPEYQQAVKKGNQTDGLGVCLRLDNDDFEDLADGSIEKEKQIIELLKLWEVEPESTDIILDFGAITDNQSSAVIITAIALISSLPFIKRWRTLTLAASAFPRDLKDVPANSSARLPRIELQIWETLLSRGDRIPRIPTFSDYGINHPIHSEVDPRKMRMSVGLRYALENEWLIFKGKNIQQHGAEQFNQFCNDLIKLDDYKGREFSWADEEIYNLAKFSSNTGNATTWRKIGFNHHLTLTVTQLATRFGS